MFRPLSAAILAFVAIASNASAHFPWLATDDAGHALLYFSESPAERDYHVPDAVAKAEVTHVSDGDSKTVDLALVEEDTLIGRRSEASYKRGVLQTQFQYGVYGDMLLNYYARHYASLDEPADEPLDFNVRVEPTDHGVDVLVAWKGEPLAGAKVALATGERDAPSEKTDSQGRASFRDLPVGLVGFLVNHSDDSVHGELDGEPYKSAAHYATVTFHNTAKPEAIKDAPAGDAEASALPPLPEPVASFGAAVCDGWLYVYSGHTGKEHAHSRDNLSTRFVRLALDRDAEAATWESLPMQTALQGLPLVAHDGGVVRVGGMLAKNAPGEKDDLYSVAEVARFDPRSGAWSALPNLPEPRSSHDAVVIGDTLYVVGGWKLAGGGVGEWLNTAWTLDLADPTAEWRPLAQPPFKRRALAIAEWDGKLVALGGMDDERRVSSRVDCYDGATGVWTQLADLPGQGMRGFGASAWSVGGALYASAGEGVLYRLADNGKSWANAAELRSARFFHRLLPHGAGTLLAIGGAGEGGHLRTTERIELAH